MPTPQRHTPDRQNTGRPDVLSMARVRVMVDPIREQFSAALQARLVRTTAKKAKQATQKPNSSINHNLQAVSFQPVLSVQVASSKC